MLGSLLNPDLITQYPSTVTGTPNNINNPGGPIVPFYQIYNFAGNNNTYLSHINNLLVDNSELSNNANTPSVLAITNLDVENSGVQGGPLSDITTIYSPLNTGTPTSTQNPGGPTVNFTQPYLPSNTYLTNNPIQGLGSGELDNSLNITNLDVEDSDVQGGPLSDITTVYPASSTGTPTPTANPGGPTVNFTQPYLPSNTYLDSSYNAISNNTLLDNSLNITNLDVEDSDVQGGPLSDITTVYSPLNTGTPTTTANPGGVPQRFIQPYLPSNTYLANNPIEGVGSGKLDNSLNITNLDVENSSANGGPLNDTTTDYPVLNTGTPTSTANPGAAPTRFTQPYLPSNTYLTNNPIEGVGSGKLDNSLNITNLDVEDSGANGGPLNDTTTDYPISSTGTPTSTANPGAAPTRFTQLYSPLNAYLNSSYNVEPNNTILNNSLNITNLDVEDSGVQGGIPYKPANDPTIYPLDASGMPLVTKTSAIIGYFPTGSLIATKFTQTYNPNNTYLTFIKEETIIHTNRSEGPKFI